MGGPRLGNKLYIRGTLGKEDLLIQTDLLIKRIIEYKTDELLTHADKFKQDELLCKMLELQKIKEIGEELKKKVNSGVG